MLRQNRLMGGCPDGSIVYDTGPFITAVDTYSIRPTSISFCCASCLFARQSFLRLFASFSDPVVSFGQLAGTLGGKGSSRSDTLGSRVGFLSNLGGARTSFWECSQPMVHNWCLFHACFQISFNAFLGVFVVRACANTFFRR